MIRIKPPPQKRVPLTNSFTKEQLEPNCGSNDAVLIIQASRVVDGRRFCQNGNLEVYKDLCDQNLEANAKVDFSGNGKVFAQNKATDICTGTDQPLTNWTAALDTQGPQPDRSILAGVDKLYRKYLEKEIDHSITLINFGFGLNGEQCLVALSTMQAIQSSFKILVGYCYEHELIFMLVCFGQKSCLYYDSEVKSKQRKFIGHLKGVITNTTTKVLPDFSSGISLLFLLYIIFQYNQITQQLLIDIDCDCLFQPKEDQRSYKNYITALHNNQLYMARLDEVRRSRDLRTRLVYK